VSGTKVPNSVLIPIRRLRDPRSPFLHLVETRSASFLGPRFILRVWGQIRHLEASSALLSEQSYLPHPRQKARLVVSLKCLR